MSEMDDLRAQLRDADRKAPAEGYGHLYFGALAFIAFAVGAIVVLFVPSGSQTPPARPVVVATAPSSDTPAADLPRPAPASAIDYAADPDTQAALGDGVCLQRVNARSNDFTNPPRLTARGLSDFDARRTPQFGELVHCLLTEAPARYCAAAQRTMLTAQMIAFFRGLEYQNRQTRVAARAGGVAATAVDIEPRLVAAIESRMHDGLLTRADFEKVKPTMPARLRDRLSGVPIGPSRCPPPPWWAVWR
ncbi:MAG: hypothetical protein J0H62_01915 [Rhizobiales bacterium]|nr:hypothetical protein [Hyphomicrobiales bacterium]